MNTSKFSKMALMCAASALALTTAAYAQSEANNAAPEQVTVTGSRVISDITQSPTPLTVVTADQLQSTTPTDIPDALNKLPDFIGGASPRSQNNGQNNNSGNTLNLRNLGTIRTLVLLDGQRVAPSNRDGTVNVDSLPQMLMSRVDVVTGGASAQYGSDAVAGVVNFILDKNFSGFKYDVNAGISKYGDAAEEKIGMAWGTDLFGGRGHYEMSMRVFQQDGIQINQRPYGYNHNTWVQAGAGTTADPYVNVPYGHLVAQSSTGTINCGASCPLTNTMTFTGAGQLTTFTHGIPTGTAGLESGGDGGFEDNIATLQSRQRQGEFFNRFSYDITPDINAYVEASWAESGDYSTWAPLTISSSSSRPNTFFTNNPYLSSSAQAALTAGATAAGNFAKAPVPFSPNPSLGLALVTGPSVAAGTPVFTDASYVPQIVAGQNAQSQGDVYLTKGVDRNLTFNTGLTGTLHGFDWDVFYSHQESRVDVNDPTNTNNAKLLASEDAVVAPTGTKITVGGVTTDVSGTIQCWDETQAAYAALYAGCVPMNVFNPSQGISQAAWNYVKQDTQWALTQKLDNVGGSIHGGLFGLGLPAGEITAALSAEMRWRTFNMKTNALPTDFVNCTGLRLCTQNGGAAPSLYTQNTNAPVSVDDNVWETALEFNVPILKDFPLAQDLNADISGRYTDYSISGTAETWKIGLNDRINDTIRLRSTMSFDIRAPNLNDLYGPVSITSTGFTDLLTTVNSGTQLVTKGNAALSPEQAHTYTLGVVLTPDIIPGFTTSLDYYQTHMSNAITNISYQSTSVQNLCITSAPTYSSPYCLLATRPIAPGQPGYASTANFPTQILSSPLNAALVQMEGWDFEADYSFDWADVWSAIPGSVTLRHLMTYQPVLENQNLPATPFVWTPQPKTRMTSFIDYTVGDWGLSIQNQWLSGWKKANGFVNQVYLAPRISSYDAMDVTINRRFDMWGGSSTLYFNVQNIGNTRAPLNPSNASNPGLFYPVSGSTGPGFGYSDVGRYFTVGLKGNF
ncbi:MAG TPA: TonB-dependent receptor [Rhizomicrobium sp.]|nr:TonB-dependent receptor [Rhizomicrobium sp.]